MEDLGDETWGVRASRPETVPSNRAMRGAATPRPSGETGLGIPSEVKGPLRVKARRAGRGAEGPGETAADTPLPDSREEVRCLDGICLPRSCPEQGAGC